MATVRGLAKLAYAVQRLNFFASQLLCLSTLCLSICWPLIPQAHLPSLIADTVMTTGAVSVKFLT
jgi:hypothetical protein